MSISGILSSGFLQRQLGVPSTPYQQGIEQLSKDLQSGNLAAAQSDFATLQKAFSPSPSSTAAGSTASTSNLVTQAFNQLATDLKSGNLSAAQEDFSALQQDVKNLGGPVTTNRPHHHHRLTTGTADVTNPHSPPPHLNQARQNLTSGNLFAAQQAYATLQAHAPVSTAFGLRQTEPPVSGPPTSVGGLVDPELIGPPVSVLA
jgi:outer membrane protein assembly factor BamD (BamD/ComL family)